MRSAVLNTILFPLLLCVSPAELRAEEPVENLVLITLDGLRSEEVFSGADERLMIPELGVKDRAAWLERYGGDSPQQRRRRLLPFLWSRIEKNQAWIAGSLQADSSVKVTNGRYFSYPGYNEVLCGFGDPQIDSNDKKYNENITVLEFLNNQPEFVGSVQAFCSWDVFPFIINDQRSHIPVNAGWMPLTSGDENRLEVLNNVAKNLFHEWEGVRYDVLTSSAAIECMRHEQPRVLYVSLGETDDWAHAGRYDRYLLTAEQNDRFIQQLWAATQQIPQYRDKTAFIISTDHGRGDGREGWKSHGVDYPGSDRIWIAAFGAGISARGIDQGGEFTQSQIAATVAQLLGYDFTQVDSRIAPALDILTVPLQAVDK
ncbi:MAG: hypothetical protein NXI32_28800 [bacterium]|nr:hypothetical protein [bacterium]